VLRGVVPVSVSVHVGLSDGTYTEVIDGELKEGDQVVTEALGTEDSSSTHGPPSGGAAGGMPRMRL
jgi:HlyD family secretion protein